MAEYLERSGILLFPHYLDTEKQEDLDLVDTNLPRILPVEPQNIPKVDPTKIILAANVKLIELYYTTQEDRVREYFANKPFFPRHTSEEYSELRDQALDWVDWIEKSEDSRNTHSRKMRMHKLHARDITEFSYMSGKISEVQKKYLPPPEHYSQSRLLTTIKEDFADHAATSMIRESQNIYEQVMQLNSGLLPNSEQYAKLYLSILQDESLAPYMLWHVADFCFEDPDLLAKLRIKRSYDQFGGLLNLSHEQISKFAPEIEIYNQVF